MNMTKLFNNWISLNFKGLSAHTLCQLIGMEYILPVEYINNMVYVDLFHVFSGKATEEEQNSYDSIRMIVNNCEWL